MPLLETVVVMDPALHCGMVRRSALQATAEAARGKGAAALRRAVRVSPTSSPSRRWNPYCG